MDYGYCGNCREFHGALADFDPEQYTSPPIRGGGWMRCCGDSLRAWAVYHPAPWEAGTLVRCVFSDDPLLHVMQLCHCGHWHWAKAMCGEPTREPAGE